MTDQDLDRIDDQTLKDFATEAPALLDRVMGQLRDQSQRLRQMGLRGAAVPDLPRVPGLFDLSDLDPHAPGAFGELGAPGSAPATGPA
ncbi:MAG: hypothetical protein LBS56_02015, partial [Propionibacteriaceae bacterium]|nr:hypothetical protein [Propionibacteriaceae bacterium]